VENEIDNVLAMSFWLTQRRYEQNPIRFFDGGDVSIIIKFD
jgi:hypothetical protein